MNLLVVVLLIFTCLGIGSSILAALRILSSLSSVERIAWSFAVGYGGLVVMIGLCIFLLWRSRLRGRHVQSTQAVQQAPEVKIEADASSTVTLRRRLSWVLAAFVPSSLMLGVTAHITSNLAPVPLLWVAHEGLSPTLRQHKIWGDIRRWTA